MILGRAAGWADILMDFPIISLEAAAVFLTLDRLSDPTKHSSLDGKDTNESCINYPLRVNHLPFC